MIEVPRVSCHLRNSSRSLTRSLPDLTKACVAGSAQLMPRSVRGVFDRIAAGGHEADIAIVAHGAVGTLLLCQLSGIPISRAYDQPYQGHYWACDMESRNVLHGWREIAPR